MSKNKVLLKKAKWLAYCLEIGWDKELLPELERIWDSYYDKFGNKIENKKSEK